MVAVAAVGGGGMYVYSNRGRSYRSGGTRNMPAKDDSEEFVCTGTEGKSIAGDNICDLIQDCPDGSDERSPTPCQGKCTGGERALHTVLFLITLVWFFICARKGTFGGLNVYFMLTFTIPLGIMAFSMLIMVCVCAGSDKTQETNMNIVLLTFTGISCLVTLAGGCCVGSHFKKKIAEEERKQQASRPQAQPAFSAAQVPQGMEIPPFLAKACGELAVQPKTLKVQVPSGAAAGTTLQVQTPEGLVIQVQVPMGMFPGAMFTASYLAPANGLAPPGEVPVTMTKVQAYRCARKWTFRMTVLLWVWLLVLIILSSVKSPFSAVGDVIAKRVWFGATLDTAGVDATVTASTTLYSSSGQWAAKGLHESPMSPPLGTGGGKKIWRAPTSANSATLTVTFKEPKGVVMLTLQQDPKAPNMAFTLMGSGDTYVTLAQGTLTATTSTGYKTLYDLYVPSTTKWNSLELHFTRTSAFSTSSIGLNELNVFTGAGDPADAQL
jgi:hypothetical protein